MPDHHQLKDFVLVIRHLSHDKDPVLMVEKQAEGAFPNMLITLCHIGGPHGHPYVPRSKSCDLPANWANTLVTGHLLVAYLGVLYFAKSTTPPLFFVSEHFGYREPLIYFSL